jgi:hypothetical protein
VEKVSSLQEATFGGLALKAKNGKSIYYFGGYGSPTTVQKFDFLTNSVIRLPTELPSKVFLSGGVSMRGTIFLFDGWERHIMEFREKSGTARIIGHLSFQNVTSGVPSTTAIPDGKVGVWLFAGSLHMPPNPVLLFNTTTKDVYSSSANTTLFPTLYAVPVVDGRFGYLIGGLGLGMESDGSTHSSKGILR